MQIAAMNILRRGFSDTISHIKTLIGAAFTGCASLVALYVWKGRDMAIEEFPFVAVAIIGALSGVVFILIWNIAAAPYRIQKDRADALADLSKKQEALISDGGKAIVHVHNHVSYDDASKAHFPKRSAAIKLPRAAILNNERSRFHLPLQGIMSDPNGNGIKLNLSILLSKTKEPTRIRVLDASTNQSFFSRMITEGNSVLVECAVVVPKERKNRLAIEIGIAEPSEPTSEPKVVSCIVEGNNPATFVLVEDIDIWFHVKDDSVKVGDQLTMPDDLFLLPTDTEARRLP